MPAHEKQSQTAADYRGWAENERRERERERNWNRTPYDELRPAGCFSERRPTPRERAAIRPRARPEEVGQQSGTIGARLASSCAGWAQHPTAADFYAAIRAEQPTERQRHVLDAWIREASWEEIVGGWADEVYTFRELAGALHRAGLGRCRWARGLNRLARRPAPEAG